MTGTTADEFQHVLEPFITSDLRTTHVPSLEQQIADDLRAALVAKCTSRPDVPGLIARPAPENWGTYHLAELQRALVGLQGTNSPTTVRPSCNSFATNGEVVAARLAYHSRWLLHQLAPRKPEWQPTVSVVIPVYNGSHVVIDAVESVLAQSYKNIEIIVVDDGSTDGLRSRLNPFLHDIQFVSKPRGGCGSARNYGLRLARGDFVQFLDADDVLKPNAIVQKVLAFAAIPDADVCMSRYDCAGHNGVVSAQEFIQTPLGGRDCTTRDLMNATIRWFAMSYATVLLPRWVCLEVGGFDESLLQAEDSRFTFRLACRRSKVIALDRELTTVRLTPGSLTTNTRERDRFAGYNRLLYLIDLLQDAQWWPYVGLLLSSSCKQALGYALATADARAARLRSEVHQSVLNLPSEATRNGVSVLPLLRVLESAERRQTGIKQLLMPSRTSREQFVDQATPVNKADIRLWSNETLPSSLHIENWSALNAIAPTGTWTRKLRQHFLRSYSLNKVLTDLRRAA